jgi:hypothetical protein
MWRNGNRFANINLIRLLTMYVLCSLVIEGHGKLIFEDYVEVRRSYQEASLSDGRYGANRTSGFSQI